MKKLENQNTEYKGFWRDNYIKWIHSFVKTNCSRFYIGVKSIMIIFICLIILNSCGSSNNGIDITKRIYIINLNSNIVHKMSCQTIPKMSERNKKVSDQSIEEILSIE